MARVPSFRVEDFSFTLFSLLVHLNLDVNVRHLETLPEKKYATTYKHINYN